MYKIILVFLYHQLIISSNHPIIANPSPFFLALPGRGHTFWLDPKSMEKKVKG